MTGKGNFTAAPNRRLAYLLGAQVFWLLMVFFLGVWWGRLLLRQGTYIVELEERLGLTSESTEAHWARTQHMLFWESSVYFGLLILGAALLVWLYSRDLQRTRSMQAFFASLTHELRTPLTSIRLQAESLADNATGGVSPLVSRLLEDTQRLESQVERTLELARVEGGGSVFLETIDLRQALESAISNFRQTHPEPVRVDVRIEDSVVEADSAALQVILKNLLENSLKHAQKYSPARNPNKELAVTLTVEKQASGVLLSFQDNGEGFSGNAKQLGKIFQKGPASQGAGVGLYLIRVLMERMNGWARFSSDAGFRVSLWFKEAKET